MINQIVSLSRIFIAIPSVIGNQTHIDSALSIMHQDLSDYNHKLFLCNGFSSILYYNTPTYHERFKVILNGNLDVAAGKPAQFKPYIKDGKLYGRGAYDMKAAAAVLTLVFKEVAEQVSYPLALQVTTDQELDGHFGTKYQIEQGVRGDFIINTSTTNLAISNESKGNMRMKITARGKQASSAYLWEGENAIWEMKKFLDRLEKAFPQPKKEAWETTINMGIITTDNMDITTVPEDCHVYLDIKYIQEDKDSIVKQIQHLIPDHFTSEVLINEPPHFTPRDNPYIPLLGQALEKVTSKPYSILRRNWVGEIRHYNEVGCEGICLGPIGSGAHADDEWVDIQSLVDYYHTLKEFLLSL